MGAPPVAELVAPFAKWLGRWDGEGRGLWVADPPFRYRESLTIEAVPDRALLRLAQRTEELDTGELSHSEVDFLRLLPEEAVELMLAIPAGNVKLHTGRLQGGILALQPQTISGSPTSRPLRLVQRTLELDHEVLRSAVAIAIGDEEMAPHVQAWLHRSLSAE